VFAKRVGLESTPHGVLSSPGNNRVRKRSYKQLGVLTVFVLVTTGTLVVELVIVTFPRWPIGKRRSRTAYGHRCCRKGRHNQQSDASSHIASHLLSVILKTKPAHLLLWRM
jgi:hypothetical protein